MDSSELQKLEGFCQLLYGGGQSTLLERLEAQRWLLRLQSSAQYLPQLEYALEHSQSQYALLFSAKGLLLIVTNDWRNVTSSHRLQLQVFLLNRLATYKDPKNFITKAIIHALCRLTKLGWCSDPQLRGLMDEIIKFLQAGVAHAVLGLHLLADLVSEFELGRSSPTGRLDAESRLIAQAFREQDGLTKGFLLALDSVTRAFNSNNVSEDRPVLKAALNTLQTCLAFDFVGTGHAENDDVVACLYIPMEWTKHIATASALRMLFRIYNAQWQVSNESEIDCSHDGVASMSLQCIALLASTRRSAFDEKSRQEFLVALLEGSALLMKEKTGLSHSGPCLHHLCRLLSRVKSHFQLVELTKSREYPSWLQALATFTEEILSSWRSVSTRSTHYIIRLWGAMVLPTPYLRVMDGAARQDGSSSTPTSLIGFDQYVPRVVQAFVQTRADMCAAAALDELEEEHGGAGSDPAQGCGSFGKGNGGIEDNPLDDEGMLLEQLGPLSTLARFHYHVSAPAIAELFVKALNERQQAVAILTSQNNQQMAQAKRNLTDAQARLAFITYVIGAIIGGHISMVRARAIERLEELNNELAALVFKMVTESQRTEDMIASHGQSPAALIFGFGSNAGWRLELATLYFFRCFQSLYIESRIKEDQLEKPVRNRPIELVENSQGFLNFSFLRRGAIGAQSEAAPGAMVVQNASEQTRSLPSASPSLEVINRSISRLLPFGGSRGNDSNNSSMEASDNNDTNMETNKNGNKDSTPCPSPLVVDELSAAELAAREKKMNDDAIARAAAMQRSIATIVGVQGGDRALLDIAMRRVFGLLQYAQYVNEGNIPLDESSAPVMLVQRALSVLYQLSVGVTIVHAGRSHPPRLMSSGRLLLESEVIQDLLRNPSAARFPLLREPKHGRARSFLLATLAKLLFTQTRYPSSQHSGQVPRDMFDVNANVLAPQDQVEERFVAFMEPITVIADGLLQMVQNNPMQIRQQDLHWPIIGLFRDLRGIISSASTAREYELLFSWFYPNRIKLLALVASAWNDTFDVMVPLLKLLSELVHNRGSRISFPAMSAAGIVLFREACKVLVAFCQPQLQALERQRESERAKSEQQSMIKKKLNNMSTDVNQSIQEALGTLGPSGAKDPMSMQALQEAVIAMGEEFLTPSEKKSGEQSSGSAVVDVGPGAFGPGVTVDLDSTLQKCSRVCLVTFTRMLNGRYAQLGTFELFGDTCLQEARRIILELALSGSPKHVMSFPKMARALMMLLNQLAEKFVLSLVDISSSLFARMMACLGEALVSSQTSLSTPASYIIETIAVFRCKSAATVFSENNNTNENDPMKRVRSVLNPQHRTRGDVTCLDDYKKAAHLFRAHEQAHPNIFGSLLGVIMHELFSMPATDSQSQWSIAKPVMPLILCAPQEFERQRAEFLNAQSSDREPRVREAYDRLFSRFAPALSNPSLFNLLLRTNDAFSKQLCTFCRDVRRD
uniref:Exportin-7/Ran-binding protein 17 TPR repeats domain-containing protein n=1 Tax=Mucochytrium quahogii TaxID=96639 RepID=A0A7S2RDB0_9STRA|mmetsp:Transcript_12709/g.22960  ORF Transcript_12709/g.22960 Transcript_12709/m.22960 type:complete len:1471 (-) Transcript_12709:26-4438(-)